jgi:hypothetical protein
MKRMLGFLAGPALSFWFVAKTVGEVVRNQIVARRIQEFFMMRLPVHCDTLSGTLTT